MATQPWTPDQPDDQNNNSEPKDDEKNQPSEPFGEDPNNKPDPPAPSDRSDRCDAPSSPESFCPSLSDLGKPPPEDPLQWNPRLREVLDLIRGHSSADLQHALVSMGFVREEDVLQALAVECRMERVDWNNLTVPPDLLSQIPGELAWRYHVFPVRYDETTLWVALDNPLDPRILLDLEEELGKPVRGAIAAEGEILRMLGMHYD